ncbi:type II toxin-antitoxin system RelE/ParE family toxin [Neorhizobium galegae]|uniref:type II toxin-antitoxin system RelE/ParE family toxin n=1 Tax=Neorhizobium galegae TaxID=399 RepID=UPI0006212D18|nr:type II toxin-antitoxin system RelE/ParE family toxin [Neorhizobium galegae]MCQ1764478.1 type II toxin-antitoxin system RelE/ParE family toxin [Neorhizobium galegae]MCQ1845817.1 type II toxin-antitoxin system RelE/ParE family toxin [Neorhizobium galegae]CDZ40760.1 Hypothetical protein NGAL_HAMBI1146_40330 [Neorhizobium galegae bv. officinalis]
MARLRYLDSAQDDLIHIFKYIARESGSISTAERFVKALRQRCRHLASLPGEMGRTRSELGPNLRSSAYRGYIIYFRYQTGTLEVGNILEGHRDAARHFGVDIASEDEA